MDFIKIALRMVADNVKKTRDGVHMLVIDDNFIRGIKSSVIRDKAPALNSYHCNICEVTYEKIQKAIKYTCKYCCDRVISYSMIDIKNLLENLTSEFLTEYKLYASQRPGGSRIKEINNAFRVNL